MKSLFSTVLLALLFSIFSFAQDQKTTTPPADDMKAWQEYMTPGDNHKMMAESVGDWTFKMKMWMDPSAAPEMYEGTVTNEMILGGRYLHSVSKGTMMNMPFEGNMIQGYDNKTKEFVSVWIDNFGTGVMISRGTYDPATKKLTLLGTSTDPMTGEQVANRQVTSMTDNNHQKMEYYMVNKGQEFKTMEIDYTRK